MLLRLLKVFLRIFNIYFFPYKGNMTQLPSMFSCYGYICSKQKHANKFILVKKINKI